MIIALPILNVPKIEVYPERKYLAVRLFLRSRIIGQGKRSSDFKYTSSCGISNLDGHYCATISIIHWWRSNLWHRPVTSDDDLLNTSHRSDLPNHPLLISGIFDINGFPSMSHLIGNPK